MPVDYRTGKVHNAHDPEIWMTADAAISTAAAYGESYGVGFVFSANDPFFFLDIDKCLQPDGTWSPVALDVLASLPGAAVEVSQSGRGLHVFAMGDVPGHKCKNIAYGLELYTQERFVALTGNCSDGGTAATDSRADLEVLVSRYFQGSGGDARVSEWTTEPVEESTPILDDDELLAKAIAVKSAASTFGNAVCFQDLWEANVDALSGAYEDPSREYDASSADAALAQHLAFWTGSNCERMLILMARSALVRDKWNREDYLTRTILHAVRLQKTFYNIVAVDNSVAEEYNAPKLRAASDKQREFAMNIRAEKLAECAGNVEMLQALCATNKLTKDAKFWIDNNNLTAAELVKMVTPVSVTKERTADPEIVSGYQYLTAELQLEFFKGCVYVEGLHRIFTPKGNLLKSEQFNAAYGGYVFQVNEAGTSTTTKAWDAFVLSQVCRYPKADATCFRPLTAPGTLVEDEGRMLVNVYTPVETERVQGDPSRFLEYLAKLLPAASDREILISYMAAVVQHKGVKFQWCPLIQGVEGNGKTLLTRCVAFAIGSRYTHMPPASEISEKFNEWLFYKLFIGVEDVYTATDKREMLEILKPMITNDRLAMRAMQQSQVMGDNYANFILNTNHRDGIRKTQNDRRFAVFFTAQQTADDLKRDGMGGAYFPKLYHWLRFESGYAIISEYLHTYSIPDALNPATSCHRAPATTTTHEAIEASLGGIEQEVIEAISAGRPGFAGGWVSSMALDRLLERLHLRMARNKRREMMEALGYEYHPGLPGGRVTTPIQIDEGGKPRLYVKVGGLASQLKGAPEIARAYVESQTLSANGAAGIFASVPLPGPRQP